MKREFSIVEVENGFVVTADPRMGVAGSRQWVVARPAEIAKIIESIIAEKTKKRG